MSHLILKLNATVYNPGGGNGSLLSGSRASYFHTSKPWDLRVELGV